MKLSRLAGAGGMSATMRAAGSPSSHPSPLSLAMGEPHIAPPVEAVEAAAAYVRRGRVGYGPAAGLSALRDALAQRVSMRTGVERSSDEVVVTCGGKQALAETFRVLVNPGERVVVFSPYWPSFLDQIRWIGGEPLIVPTRDDLRPDVSAAGDLIDDRTRAIVVNDPSNPTSLCFTERELRAVAELAVRHDLWIVLDDVYDGLRFDSASHLLRVAPEVAPRTIIITSFSKWAAMPGFRVGSAAGPKPVMEALTAVISATTTHAALPSQAAALAALVADIRPPLNEYRDHASRARHALSAVSGIEDSHPDAGFYLFPCVRSWLAASRFASDDELVDHLRDRAGVRVTAGSVFGAPGHLRLSLAVDPATLDEALSRMVAAFRDPS